MAITLGGQVSASGRTTSLWRTEGHYCRVTVINLLKEKLHAVPDTQLGSGVIAILDARKWKFERKFLRTYCVRFRLKKPAATLVRGNPRPTHVPSRREVDIHLDADTMGLLECKLEKLAPRIREKRRAADFIGSAPVATADKQHRPDALGRKLIHVPRNRLFVNIGVEPPPITGWLG